MAFSEYKSIGEVVAEFGLDYSSVPDLFPEVRPAEPGELVRWYLTHQGPKALAQKTEIARREAIIAPFVFEAVARATRPATAYSGVAFRSTPKLSGFPDYLIGRGGDPVAIKAPVLAVIEAKDEKFSEGAGACAATMVAARDVNRAGNVEGPVFGSVTNGVEWEFYQLVGDALVQHQTPVLYLPPDRLLGILIAIASGTV
jgi:hypothetical protein